MTSPWHRVGHLNKQPHHSIFNTVPALESTENPEEGTEHSVLRKITEGVVPELWAGRTKILTGDTKETALQGVGIAWAEAQSLKSRTYSHSRELWGEAEVKLAEMISFLLQRWKLRPTQRGKVTCQGHTVRRRQNPARRQVCRHADFSLSHQKQMILLASFPFSHDPYCRHWKGLL